jgi:microcystin-dependent protein
VSTPFLSQIGLFSFGFAPKSWAECNGQLLPINQNQALFSLLGTTFGGDGKVTFALPDLRGRVPIGVGAGHTLGERAGVENVTLTVAEMPTHAHALNISALTATARGRNAAGTLPTPVGNAPAIVNPPTTLGYSSGVPDANMQGSSVAFGGAVTTANAGSSQPHENHQPYGVLVYCIALSGIYPSQG